MIKPLTFDAFDFLGSAGEGKTVVEHTKDEAIFSQGDRAGAVFYIRSGAVKLKVNSPRGKEAVIAILGPGDFFGEGCLTTQKVRNSAAVALGPCVLMRVEKWCMVQVIHQQPAFAELFVAHLLSRNMRFEEDLVDQLFNSSEKRLARVLLVLANFGKEGGPQVVVPKISQETLAEIVGTTRSRISFFMNKFRRLGYIDYNGRLEVHTSLLNVVLHD